VQQQVRQQCLKARLLHDLGELRVRYSAIGDLKISKQADFEHRHGDIR
jgi:hypothetical protein